MIVMIININGCIVVVDMCGMLIEMGFWVFGFSEFVIMELIFDSLIVNVFFEFFDVD